MLISLVGSHGTGKTAVFEELKKRKPEWAYITEGVRYQLPKFGYKDAFELVDEVGIGVFESMNINSWALIDPAMNPFLDPDQTIITERSAVDNYAYFLAHISTPEDVRAQKLVKNMAKHYAALVDRFVYFPLGVIPLVGDDMRSGNPEYQEKIDRKFKQAVGDLGVDTTRIYEVKSVSIEDRVNEVIELIEP